MRKFSQEQLEGIAKAFGNTNDGFTGSEIGHLLQVFQIKDVSPSQTKWVRLHNAFAAHLNKTNDHSIIRKFIMYTMFPNSHLDNQARYKIMHQNLNKAISSADLAVDEGTGEVIPIEGARTLRGAEERANTFRAKLESRGVHRDVLEFCGAELAENNYFHAVLEAAKSISYKLRDRTGLQDDGSKLAKHALGIISGRPPRIKINAFQTESDKSEQQGFLHLVTGIFSMFRNRIAHDARIQSKVDKDDLEDLLLLASIIHRRLDKATITPRTESE